MTATATEAKRRWVWESEQWLEGAGYAPHPGRRSWLEAHYDECSDERKQREQHEMDELLRRVGGKLVQPAWTRTIRRRTR